MKLLIILPNRKFNVMVIKILTRLEKRVDELMKILTER